MKVKHTPMRCVLHSVQCCAALCWDPNQGKVRVWHLSRFELAAALTDYYYYTERNILGVTYHKHFICSLLVTQWEQKSWKNRLLTSK